MGRLLLLLVMVVIALVLGIQLIISVWKPLLIFGALIGVSMILINRLLPDMR